jgi:hypothetical protein
VRLKHPATRTGAVSDRHHLEVFLARTALGQVQFIGTSAQAVPGAMP